MSKLRAFAPFALLLTSLSLEADHAEARIQGGIPGFPRFHHDHNCFSYQPYGGYYAGVMNLCDSVEWWDVALMWDSPAIFGPKTVKVTASADPNFPNEPPPECSLWTINGSGNDISIILLPPFAASGISTRQVNIPSVPVGAHTTLDCNLHFQNHLLAVEYTP